MKKFSIDLNKLRKTNKGSSWQKAVLMSLIIGTVLITASYAYLIVRPLSGSIKEIIDEEISAVDITFDQKVIDSIKERQKPSETKLPTSGKNPFAGF